MQFTQQEMGENVRKICEDETCTAFQVKDDSGEGLMTCYKVFKGCYLIYNDFHMKECYYGFNPNTKMFCVDHCREHHSLKFLFRLNHYHGLTIGFDIEEAEDSLLHVMEGFSVD